MRLPIPARKPKQITLVLSGGGARGAAHVGVLEVLKREGFRPDLIVGTSAGSIAGVLFAAGLPASRSHASLAGLRWSKVARPARPKKLGLADITRLENYLENILGGPLTFDQLQTPFVAIATDLATKQPVKLNTGRVAHAVRISCSVPGIFIPCEEAGRTLVDGGLVANLPVLLARQMGAGYIVAVDIVATPLGNYLPTNLFEMWAMTYSTVMSQTRNEDRAAADLLISPDLANFPVWDLSKWQEMLAAGRAAAEQALPQLRRDLGLKGADPIHQPPAS